MHRSPSVYTMSKSMQDTPLVDRSHPVLSGRVDPALVEWAEKNLGLTKAALVKVAVVEYVTRAMREAA